MEMLEAARVDARLSQRGDPGLGRNRVQPRGASRDRQLAGERFAQAADVLRSSPSTDALRDAFRLETKRRQRRSDGTISLEGVRFEIPARYRHFRDVVVRYARWDLGRVDLVDPREGTILRPSIPLDSQRQRRRSARGLEPRPDDARPPTSSQSPAELPPLSEENPRRVLRHGNAAGVPAQESASQERREPS